MLKEYRKHEQERRAQGIPALALNAEQVADLVELIKKDKFINGKISVNKIKNIFNYSKHFKHVNYIFRRVFK